jgi:hypothetical protein
MPKRVMLPSLLTWKNLLLARLAVNAVQIATMISDSGGCTEPDIKRGCDLIEAAMSRGRASQLLEHPC